MRRSRPSVGIRLAALTVATFSGLAFADERPVYADYDTQMKGSDHVGSLGPTWFGDQTDFYSGATSFLVTDINLPGNSGLPVSLQRSLQAHDDGVQDPQTRRLTFAWSQFEVPYLSGVYAQATGWKSGYLNGAVNERCSVSGTAPTIEGHDDIWEDFEYFRGNHLYVPGHGTEAMAYISPVEPSNPTTGHQYHWATKSQWRFSCLPSTKNGVAGEGFVGLAPDGKRYYFDWLVSWRTASTLTKFAAFTNVKEVLQRKEYRMLVTRVEDRFGNWVNYGYTGKNLTTISASDGRQLTLTYQSDVLSNVSDGVRAWSYSYNAGVTVTFPDSTTWRSSISGPGFLRYEPTICTSDAMRYTGEATVSIEHRTGATGIFIFRPLRRGLSHVYYNPYSPCQQNPKHLDGIALYDKHVSGPGLAPATWNVTYGPANGCHAYGTAACTSSSPVTRYVDVSGPGAISRYTFGNKWNDTDGALLRIQTGASLANVLRDTSFAYDTIPALGVVSGGGYLSTIIRLQRSKVNTQSGVTYSTSRSAWDEYQNPQTISEFGPNGGARTTQYTYYNNKSKWIIGEVATSSSPGNTISKTFNSDGNVATVTKNGVATAYTYHSDGNVATITYPRSLVHTFSNYKLGVPQSESQPENVNLSRVVNNHGFVTSDTDGEGRTRAYAYDVMGRVTSIDHPRGNDVTIAYSPLSRTVTRGALVETTTYDALRRPTRVVQGGIATTHSYDAYGRTIFRSNPGNTIGTNFEHDALGRVFKITHPDSSYRSFTYGPGNVTVRDERAIYTTRTYRGYGEPDDVLLMGMTAPVAAASMTIARAPNGLIMSITQAGRAINFGYDSRSYLTSETHPETGTTTYERDAAGNMTAKMIGETRTQFAYDGLNRLTGVTYSDGTPAITQIWSKTNRLRSVSSSSATRVIGYDQNDNLTSESLTMGGTALAAQYTYNENDELSSITYPISNRVVSYSPDALGRATQVSGYVSSVSYWPSGLVRQIDYSNGVISNYDQNSRLWASAFRTRRGSVYSIDSAYGYDHAGNLTSIVDAVDGSMNRSLGYDGIDRLTSASGPWGSGSIAYDGTGNITGQALGPFSLSYTYDGQNRLSGVSGARSASYAYDIHGNIVGAGSSSYAYDLVPNLRCANCGGGDDKSEYAYDGLRNRVSVTRAGITTYEFYGSSGDLLVEYTPSLASKLVEHVYLAGKRIAQRESDQGPGTAIVATRSTAIATRTGGVTLTVNVGDASTGGTVTFTENGTYLGTAYVVDGQASIDVLGLSLGQHSIVVSFSGDASHPGNTVTLEIKVINLDWLPAVLELLLD